LVEVGRLFDRLPKPTAEAAYASKEKQKHEHALHGRWQCACFDMRSNDKDQSDGCAEGNDA
jgi:hypothetical protein